MRKAVTTLAAVVLVTGFAVPVAAVQSASNLSPEEQARRQAERERVRQEMMQMPNPIEALNSVWIDELTWIEVRDEIASGKTTAIIPTGGVEQSGPYLANGKHNYVLQGACDAIARELGNALCTPVLKLVPEGDPEDVGNSLKSQGFTDIILIGDSGGNQTGMAAAADALNGSWAGSGTVAYFIPEYYNYEDVEQYMEEELLYVETVNDGYHDDFFITSLMMVTSPEAVRYRQRVAAGVATINGLSIAPINQALEVGHKLMEFRTNVTVKAIHAAMHESGR